MPRLLLIPAVILALASAATANDPGGGAPGVGANVALTTTSTSVTLSNGVITAVIQKSTGKVSSYLFNGTQMVDPANPIYYSMDGGANYEQPSNCVYSVTKQTTDMVDVSFKRTWNSTSGYKHVFDIELHYVLRRGDTGLYAYAILDHPAAYPAASVGEWRIVWKLPRSSTTFNFERAYIDDLRNWEMPSYYDYQNASPTGIAEIVKLNTGVMAGKYDGKYTYSARYYDIGTWGHASNISKKGVWFVLGGHDYFNDGPTHQDLTSSESYILMHFGRNHYGGSGTTVAAGEAWRKMYGPFLLYCNQTSATANAGDALWADAKLQVEAEKAAWPYAWLVNSDHPAASARGSVTGRLLINDPLKPSITGANAMIGLAAPEETHGNWQRQGKGYQYWVKADANGNFNIPAVRPGSYTLYAYTTGVVEEFSKANISVAAGATSTQGEITWNIDHPGTTIAWEIGVPDRTAKEFRHGNDYFKPYLWEVYPQEFPNPLVYNVGTSDPATDWNYVHSNYPGAGGATTGWNWDVNFHLPAVPRSGDAVLTVAFAGAQYPRLFLYLNGETTSFARLSPTISGGNGLLRQGIHAKYSHINVPIPVSRLRNGANTFRFSFTGDSGFSPNVMYDYLRLELPDFPPPPSDSGRSIVWAGGADSAANTWDLGTTGSFLSGSTPTAFGDGDSVTFSDSGSNSTSITLAATVQPNSVTFSGAKSYQLSGSGDLSGTMPLSKSGASTLTISQANTYSGPTSITGGTISLANDTANASGLGTSDLTLRNATLKMYSNPNTSVPSYWNIDVPGGATGTLDTDARCELRGKLTGSGTFRFRIPNASVRTSVFGDWSAFSGLIEASAMSGSADFRIAPDYNWPGIPAAALSLGDKVNAYWAGNLNTGAGTFVSIGELAGGPTSTLKGGNIGGRQITYRIGGRGGDAVFAGTISEQTNGITNLVKQGTGVWTLSGNNAVNGDVTVEAGTLNLGGTFGQIAGKNTTVADSAMMILDGTLDSASLRILAGGSLAGQGTLNGDLANDGLVELATGGFAVAGNITNSGYLRVRAPATLALGGTFTNSGVLNLIGSSQPIPPGTTNTGTILTDRAPGNVRWSGSNGPLWDIHTSVNWLDVSSMPAVFFAGDAVVFDDSATITDVELAGSIVPASVTVATSQSFTFTGGSIGGSGGLTKSGSGSLSVTSALGFTGNLSVAAGSLTLASVSSWPAASPVIEVEAGATLGVVALPSGATVGADRTLRGAGTVDGDLTITGGHDPGPGSAITGAVTYRASSRVSWALSANSTTTGSFDTISADDVVIESGASLDLVFNSPGSTVDFTQPYWSSPRSWSVVSSATRAGVFSIGTQSNDAQGGAPGGFGVFSLGASGGSLVLNWSPIPVIAVWKGVNSGNWDLSTPNWDKNGAISIYQNGITTRIDDRSSVTAIDIVETVNPGPIEFDSSLNHTIGGSAPINGTASLDKKGEGTLTLTSANGFSGGTALHSGSLAITHAAALGTGVVTLSGGRWNTGTLAPANPIVVTADSVIGGGSGNGSHGIKALSGAGVLTIDAAGVFDLEGPMSAFAGTVLLTGPGSVRLNGSFGSAAAAFELGTRPLSARNGGTYQLGSLAGQSGSLLNIASYTGGVTFNIGGNNASTIFAGNINNGPGTTTIVKSGSGTLTLAGTCTHTGNTSVSAGTLRVTGSLANTAVTVNANATLETAGAILIPSLVMQSSATLGMTAGPASVPVRVSGNVTLAGSLRATVAPGTVFGRFLILSCGGTRTGTFSLTTVTPLIPHHVSYTTGEVILFLDDSDEDSLPDTWEMASFGNLSQTAVGDFDNDGTSNLVESRLGLDPASGASSFAATCTGRTLTWPTAPGVVFTIRRNTGLDPAGWRTIGTVTGGSEPAATFTDPEPFERAFYQIGFEP